MLFINLKTNFILRYPGNCLNCNQSAVSIVETKEPIRSREISKFWRAINERTLIGSKEAGIYLKDGIKQKIKSVDSRNRDLAIRIKGIQYKSFHGKTGRYNNKSKCGKQLGCKNIGITNQRMRREIGSFKITNQIQAYYLRKN